MVLACPYVLSTHPASLTHVALPDSRYELLSHVCNHLAYSSVSSCSGSASSPQIVIEYTTCISPMMPSLDLALLRLVIIAQSVSNHNSASVLWSTTLAIASLYFCRKVTDTSVSNCRVEGSIGWLTPETDEQWHAQGHAEGHAQDSAWDQMSSRASYYSV